MARRAISVNSFCKEKITLVWIIDKVVVAYYFQFRLLRFLRCNGFSQQLVNLPRLGNWAGIRPALSKVSPAQKVLRLLQRFKYLSHFIAYT